MSAAALPSVVAHADWSMHPEKRWLANAVLQPDGRYLAFAPEPVGPTDTLCLRLLRTAGVGHALLGVDFPIGLPRAYAEHAGIDEFTVALKGFDERFYAVAERQDATITFVEPRSGDARSRKSRSRTAAKNDCVRSFAASTSRPRRRMKK